MCFWALDPLAGFATGKKTSSSEDWELRKLQISIFPSAIFVGSAWTLKATKATQGTGISQKDFASKIGIYPQEMGVEVEH